MSAVDRKLHFGGFGLLIIVYLSHSLAEEKCLKMNGSCVDTCPSDFYAVNFRCIRTCPEGSLLSSDNDTCVKCPLLSQKGECLTDCPVGTYPKHIKDTSVCVPCDSSCLECVEPDLDSCLDCPYIKFNSTCVLDCEVNSMIHGGQCVDRCPNGTKQIHDDPRCFDHCPSSLPYIEDSFCKASCERFRLGNTCVNHCPNGTWYVMNNRTCASKCPQTYPLALGNQCVVSCPSTHRYSLEGACVEHCPPDMKFVPGERVCLQKCPRKIGLAFNQVCMRKCPPGTYTTLEESGYHCLPYVGLRGIAAATTCLLVLLCVVFGIYMSKEYIAVRRSEDDMASMIYDAEKSVLREETDRFKRSATIGLIHVSSDRRSSAEQPLLPSGGV